MRPEVLATAPADDRWIWAVALAFSTVVVVTYLVLWVRRERRDGRRLEEASSLGFARPTGQFPYIDPAKCIGCGTCVAACPEARALVTRGVRSWIARLRAGEHPSPGAAR